MLVDSQEQPQELLLLLGEGKVGGVVSGVDGFLSSKTPLRRLGVWEVSHPGLVFKETLSGVRLSRKGGRFRPPSMCGMVAVRLLAGAQFLCSERG